MTQWRFPAGVKHRHGAAKDSWFSHLAVEILGEGTSNEWLEAVTDADYDTFEINLDKYGGIKHEQDIGSLFFRQAV